MNKLIELAVDIEKFFFVLGFIFLNCRLCCAPLGSIHGEF
ncbi:Uncharacterised protein [Legionella hackeliae]|nr:Uncharacterised protein [Legionella hackeliae]